jgi:hypothetical protein
MPSKTQTVVRMDNDNDGKLTRCSPGTGARRANGMLGRPRT